MTPELWRQVEELYHAAQARAPEDRAALLAQADPEIRREAESLLAQDASRDGLLDRSVAEWLTSATKLAAGAMLGPYKIECPIGAGGMGEVFRATDTRLGRAVAIKISSEQFNQRFEREARAISSLNHPNICTLHDVGPNFLVMELVEGESLAARLKRGKLSLDEALRYGGQIADALAAAHAKGIIHRDLKPGNIMVTKAGVKVLDFGLAKIEHVVAEDEHTVTAKGTILGTVQYMSPEQAQGKEADARSDIFSFGLVLYEMISGKRAFEGTSRASVMAAMLERPAPSLEGIAPAALDCVLRKCLEKDPADRWQDAGDLKAAMDLTVDIEPVAKPSRRNWIVGTAAGVVVAGVGSVGWLHRPSSNEVSPMRVEIEPPRGGRILLGRGVGASCGLSPDGKIVAYTAVLGGKTGLWIRPLAGAGPRMVAGMYASSPFWAPDNKSVAFGQEKLWRVDVAGGAPWTVCEKLPGGYFKGGAWNADGHILFGSEGNGLFQVPASGGNPRPLTELDRSRGERSHEWPQALSGGRFLYLAVSHQAESSGIYAASLARPSERVHLLATNVSALYAPGGDGKEYLLWQRAGALVAQEFDAAALKVIGEPHLVTTSIGVSANGMMASVSANGSLIYAASAAIPSRLTWFNREGRSLGTVGEAAEYHTLRLSPDERQVAVLRTQADGQEEISILQSSRGVAIRFAEGTASAWSPGCRTVIYSAGSPRNVFRQGVGGSQSAERLTQSSNPQFVFDWSRDGRFIIYQEKVPGNRGDLMVMELRPDGALAGIRPWLKTEFTEMEARFSPEHPPRWVAYGSTESGREEIYIDSFLGPRRKVRVSTDGGRSPQWRSDGRELFFQSPDYKLMGVYVKSTADVVETEVPHELFALPIVDHNLSAYEAAPDGQRFLVNATTEQSSPLTLIVNWPALLKNQAGQ